jgi:RHS repeat-associated protein
VNNHITSNGFAYDAAGNMTNDSIHSYTYDAEGRLKGVDSGNTAKYNYDAFGNRTMQFSTTPAVYNEYVVDPSGRAITAIQPGTSNVYTAEVFAGGRHWVTDNGSALFLGTDWLGTTRALTELNGTFAQLYTSLPWGDGLSSGGSSFDTTSQYTGKEYDPESGLYHFPARQYAPVQGRWLTPDPAGIGAMDLNSPQSWNRYAYVGNNPLSFADPLGLERCPGPPPCECTIDGCGANLNGVGGPNDPINEGIFLEVLNGYWPGDGGAWVTTSSSLIYFPGGNGSQDPNNGFTLGIRAPGQTYSQCLAANSANYSVYNWLPSSWQNGGTQFALGNDVSGALFGNASEGTAGLLVGAGAGAAPLGVGEAGTFGRRTASIFDLNLSGTTGPAPTILGETGAAGVVGWVSGAFELKLAADIGTTAAEALNCIGHR